MRGDQGDRDALRALVAAVDWAPMGTNRGSASVEEADTKSAESEETPQEQGFHETRPAGFEPATSASGGQRSIH